MRRIKLTIEYDGTHYIGWQTQPNGPSIQAALEEALRDLCQQALALHGSGRTDSGVHALAQVAHFSVESTIPAGKFAAALNTRLARDISVVHSEEVDEEFHARFSASWKWYRYTILNRKAPSALMRTTSCWIPKELDLAAMQKAATCFEGDLDFRAFCAEPDRQKSTVRTVFKSAIHRHKDCLFYDCVGSGFLYNMVRVLTGALIRCGRGDLDVDGLKEIQRNGNRDLRCPTAAAQGLCLMQVGYAPVTTEDLQEIGR